MDGLFTIIIIAMAVISVIGKNKKNSRRSSERREHSPAESRRQSPLRRLNSAGEDGRFDRAAQHENSVGEDGRFHRSAQRENSVGDVLPKTRHQRMVEEQRERAAAYRREQAASKPKPQPKAKETRPLCPACGRVLKPGLNFCPSCGTATSAYAAAAVSNIPADAGIFAAGDFNGEHVYTYSDGDRPPTVLSPAPKSVTAAQKPALVLPAFTGPELTRSLVMAEILGPCKARQHH